MNKPKRHHYLPQFYLEHFCKEQKFWVFDRERGEIRIQTPINTALQAYYYSRTDEHGNRETGIEELLADIESETKGVIEKLIAREKITGEEKSTLSMFVAFMFSRVPDFEKSINKVA